MAQIFPLENNIEAFLNKMHYEPLLFFIFISANAMQLEVKISTKKISIRYLC